jgi:hypothetical protein
MTKPFFLNKKKSLLLCALFIAALPFTHYAQVAKMDSTLQSTPKHKMSGAIGLSAGSGALAGVDLAFHVLRRVSIRVGYNYLDAQLADVSKQLNFAPLDPVKEKVAINLDVAQSNVAFLADIHLNKKGSLRATIGANYTFVNTYSGKMAYTGTETYNELVISPEDIGYLKGTISTASKINPYIGLGLGRAVPRKRIGLSLDLGTYYRGSPIVKLEATQLLRGNTANEAPLNRNLAPYKWYPIANLRLAVKLF